MDKQYRIVAEQYGTPYYLFSINKLYERIKAVKDILGPKIQLCYAVKANPFLISYINPLVDKFEVCSPGEYRICKDEGIDLSKIILSGVYKEKEDLMETFSDGFQGVYTLESRNHCELLYELAKKNNQRIRVLPRLTSGNQFGMNKEAIEEIFKDDKYKKYFTIEGIHFYSGTQKKNHKLITEEFNGIMAFFDDIKKQCNCSVRKLEYGPGLFFDYFGDKTESLEEIQYLSDQISGSADQVDITIELGRYISALCGKYVTQVVDVKKNHEINYAITDGGIHQMGYHGQMLGIKNPRVSVIHRADRNRVREKWMVCGALCTVQDILLKNYETDTLCEGDLLVFHDTGAYAITDTNVFFLSRDLPVILAEDIDGNLECLRGRMQSSQFNTRNNRESL